MISFHSIVRKVARVLSRALAVTIFAPAPWVFAVTSELPVPTVASGRLATLQVHVAPDRADWTYALGAPVKFRITVTADNEPLEGVAVKYSVGAEMMPTPEQRAPLPSAGLVVDGGTLKMPGFVRCSASVDWNGAIYRGMATAGFAPEKIQPTQISPDDFDIFGQEGRTRSRKSHLNPNAHFYPNFARQRSTFIT